MGVYGRCDSCSHEDLRREQALATYAPAMALQSPPICQSVQHVLAGKRPP